MSYRDLAIVAAFTAVVMLPFQGKAFHIDEPFFISEARGAVVNTSSMSWPQINNNPPMIVALLRQALPIAGADERALRLLFFPFDLMSAVFLYLLAARFLKKPLWPVLTVIVCPAYLINLNHLMAEKLAFAFGLAGLYALVRGVDDEDQRWYWGSAALLALALLSKYIAVFMLPTAAFYSYRRGVAWPRIAGYLALASSGLALWIVGAGGLDVFRGVSAVTRQAGGHLWSDPSHRMRSILAFTGGCSLVALVWPLSLTRKKTAAACLALAAALFSPWFDIAGVRLADRLTGAAFSAGALIALAGLADRRARAAKGRPLWLAWIAASAFLIFNYWSVMARTVLFCLPALAFAWAEVLENNLAPRLWRRMQIATFAAVAVLGLASALVDYRYAQAQKETALAVAREYPPSGRTVWFAGHLGLKHYLLEAGARELDWDRGGWDLVKPGDVVVISKTNVNPPSPRRRFLANVRKLRIESPIPLRLISGFGGEGGFFSNISGFLPYSPSLEPVEEFQVVEAL